MIKSTKIIAVDSKGGRRSRTGSFVSMGVTDREAIECQDYFLDLADGEEPTGRVKKIELVIYYDMEEAETIESLRAEINRLKDFVKDIDKVVDNIGNSSEKLIEDVVIEQDEDDDVIISENEHLPANQLDLKLYEDGTPKPCKLCMSNLDGNFCKLECRRNPESESDIDLFEVIPMSMRL